MKRFRLVLIAAVVVTLLRAFAQTPNPNPNPLEPAPLTTVVPATTTTTGNDQADETAAALSALAEMKATNAEIIRQQEATLELIEELSRQADQLRIFAKRG